LATSADLISFAASLHFCELTASASAFFCATTARSVSSALFLAFFVRSAISRSLPST
jgi:hypothetical protein